MPQIAQILETYASQIFWMLITFGIIYFGIAKMMLPKISGNMESRDQKIASDLAAAEKARAKAQEAEGAGDNALNEARSEAQAAAAKAKAKAAENADKRLAEADAEIDAQMASAEKSLAKSRSKALGQIESVASEAAIDITQKVAGIKTTSAQASKAVKAVMANG